MTRLPVAVSVALAFAPALAAPARGAVEVTATAGLLDVRAAGAPVSEVLDGLARKTKMKVVYEGAAPRTLVSVDLSRRTPAEAVLGVLEGSGLDYALILDAGGTEVETLMIVGPGGPPPPPRAASATPAMPEPEPIPDVAAEEAAAEEADVAHPRAGGQAVPEPAEPGQPKFGPVNPPPVTFPTSPFAPAAPRPQPPVPTPAPSPATNR